MKVALLDMYKNIENLGMRSIQNILSYYDALEVDVFDVRGKTEIPGLDHDIYIFSGGPGSPLEGDGVWDRGFYFLLTRLWQHNQRKPDKKYCFFICHSFQMACSHLSLGALVKRHKPSIGVMTVHKTAEGKVEPVFEGLNDPFYAGDFRTWQVVRPDYSRFESLGCKIIALEKIRPHVPYERAVMGVRFSTEWVGVQFHPEADPEGMIKHLKKPEKKAEIIEKKGQEKYVETLRNAEDPEKLGSTFNTILPRFIELSMEAIKNQTKIETT